MSLDIGVGLAYLTGSKLAPYAVEPPWSSDPLLHQGIDYQQRATVLDLFDLPVALDPKYAAAPAIRFPGVRRIISAPVYDSVMRVESAAAVQDEDFDAFCNRRERVFTLDEESHGNTDLLVDVPTLGMYSYFFYGGRRRAELRQVLGQLRPRRPYIEFADRIAATLAPFNAVHIRRGDFRYSQLAPRADRVTGDEVTRNLASRLSSDERLVVCTDSSSEEDWFAPLQRQFNEVVFLDRMLLESNDLRYAFGELPFHDDTVLALVSQLVSTRARCFIGTLFSSFTAMIQRARGIESRQPEFLFCYSDWDSSVVPFDRCEFLPVQDGSYSWNRILYPVAPSVISWLRDWPESFQSSPVDLAPNTFPADSIVLTAAAARVHGQDIRYERSCLHDNIGYWTNPRDYVTWDFSAAGNMRCRVEIRYACPDTCAGSAYIISLDGGASVSATVASTGDWTAFSSWQSLGLLDIPTGHQTLAVRVVTMPFSAAMNLAAVRLIPIGS